MKVTRESDWNRCHISLVSEGMPTDLRNRDGDNQEKRLWDALSELGGKGLTLNQIVKECERCRYHAKGPVRDSVRWHLKNFAKPDRNIVRIEF